MDELSLAGIGLALASLFAMALWAVALRRVVKTNEVHIVQARATTTSFGREQAGGNTYYAWPSWLPGLGRVVTILPMSIFQEKLDNYQAYDMDRLPFVVDVIGFFQITESNTAAQRNASFNDLQSQIKGIVQGAIRSILASHPLSEIMQGRSKFSTAFTEEVAHQLEGWGVKPVKPLELMDIRDVEGSKVIANIMAVKKAEIDKTSRVAVALNKQAAEMAEIDAQRQIDLQKQEAAQLVGKRTAEADQTVRIAQQVASQEVATAEAITAEKQMIVRRVNEVQAAEIDKAKNTIEATQNRDVMILESEGRKKQAELAAEGAKNAALFAADGVRAKGDAEGAAATALAMAPVNAQLALAREIGANEKYQGYLVTIKQVETAGEVGKWNAAALKEAKIQVFATPSGGLNGVFSPSGGLQLGSMLEGVRATPTGGAIWSAIETALAPKPNGTAAH